MAGKGMGWARMMALVAGAASLVACGGPEAVDRSSEPSVAALLANAPFPTTGAPTVVDDSDPGFALYEGDPESHSYQRAGTWWERVSGTSGAMGESALEADAGMTHTQDAGGDTRTESASVAMWTAELEPGEYAVYAWLAPHPDYVTSAVYCIFEPSVVPAVSPTCKTVDQTQGEPRWVLLGKKQLAGTVEVGLDPIASMPQKHRVYADAVVYMPTRGS